MYEKKKDFEKLILETVDEELKNLRKSGNSFHLRLPREQSFTKERKDAEKIQLFSRGLEKFFGSGAHM